MTGKPKKLKVCPAKAVMSGWTNAIAKETARNSLVRNFFAAVKANITGK